MARLIDADELYLGKFNDNTTEYHIGWNDALDAAALAAPTVDAVPVVRCRDCKHYDYEYQLCVLHSITPDAFSDGCDVDMKPDDFCSYGERKDGGGNG